MCKKRDPFKMSSKNENSLQNLTLLVINIGLEAAFAIKSD